jgi:hypothetical protein
VQEEFASQQQIKKDAMFLGCALSNQISSKEKNFKVNKTGMRCSSSILQHVNFNSSMTLQIT